MKDKYNLTRKQKAFADIILANPTISAKAAATQVFDVKSERIAEVVGSEYQRKPEIMRYLSDHAKDAEGAIVEVMNNARDRLESSSFQRLAGDMANSILDRVHGKATQRVEMNSTSVAITIDLSLNDDET